MKPDKHKQKRSQQYKNSHGVKNDKDGKSQSTKGRSNENKIQGSDTVTGRGVRGDTYPQNPATHGKEEESSSDESEKQNFHRRRGLVSNWERYEELQEENESVTSCGADFSILLQGTSSAASQFRFADEIALDEDLAETIHNQSCLTIDPHDLAAALNCIPLHKKLNIDKSLFQKEDLELFKQDADKHKKSYEQHCMQHMERKRDSRNQPETVSFLDNDIELEHVLQNKSTDLSKNNSHHLPGEQQKKTELSNDVLEDLEVILSATEPIKVVNSESNGENGIYGVDNTMELNEMDGSIQASDLTSICVQTSKHDMDSSLSEGQSPNNTTKVSKLEDELDELLSFDDKENTRNVLDQHKSSKMKTTSKETDDLEDWLDSVLDA